MEPRTLNQGQLNHAREIAADVAQKMEPREASAIFFEGLELMSGAEIKELTLTDDEEKEMAQNIVERPGLIANFRANISNIDSPDPNIVKEPFTAPC